MHNKGYVERVKKKLMCMTGTLTYMGINWVKRSLLVNQTKMKKGECLLHRHI